MRKLSYLIVFLCMSIVMAIAQNKTTSETVISLEDGQPILGATVTVKGNATSFGKNFARESTSVLRENSYSSREFYSSLCYDLKSSL